MSEDAHDIRVYETYECIAIVPKITVIPQVFQSFSKIFTI